MSRVEGMDEYLGGGYLGRRRRFEPVAVIGLLVTLLLHGGGVVGLIVYKRAQAAASQNIDPMGQYVVAELVRLGKKRDEKKLPNKYVPPMPTDKVRGVNLDAAADDKPVKKRKERNRDAKISNKLRNALDKAALFAKIQDKAEQEGDPNGVAHGTAKSGRQGDLYMTRIADLWNRNWSLPSIIPREEAKKLYVLVVIRIDKAGRVQDPVEFKRRSGNAHFDASVIAAWKKIGTIPLPPADRLASMLANGMRLKLNWKGLR